MEEEKRNETKTSKKTHTTETKESTVLCKQRIEYIDKSNREK